MEFKIVAEESVDFRIVIELRKVGFEVYAICEEIPSIIDGEVLAIAVNKDALLITEGKDFGELVFRLHLPHKGILLIRIEDPNIKVTKVANTIANYCQDLYGKFAVIDETKLRIKE